MEDQTILKLVGIIVVGGIYAYGLHLGLDPTFGSLSIVLTAIAAFAAYSAGHIGGAAVEKMHAAAERLGRV